MAGKKNPTVTKAKIMSFRLREPDLEALHGLAAYYRIGRSEVIRFLLIREWAKIQTTTGVRHDERGQ